MTFKVIKLASLFISMMCFILYFGPAAYYGTMVWEKCMPKYDSITGKIKSNWYPCYDYSDPGNGIEANETRFGRFPPKSKVIDEMNISEDIIREYDIILEKILLSIYVISMLFTM